MTTADRNVWDKSTPSGYTDLVQPGLVVDLCIYLFENSAKDEEAVRADVTSASGIWCQRRINIQVGHMERLGPLLPTKVQQEGQVDLNHPALAEASVACPLTDAVRDQFFDIPRHGCVDLTTAIAVFYIPGSRFVTGGSGCHSFYYPAGDVPPRHIIILSDDATGNVLAHELGHALFTKSVGQAWENHDPGPNQDPSNPIHNANSANLMFPSVPEHPTITVQQGVQAQQSLLTHQRDLVIGFRENKPAQLGVKIKSMTVHHSKDEWTSDDALESRWNFKASLVRNVDNVELTSKNEGWHKDPLHWFTYPLDKDLYPLVVTSDSDKLVVEVTGMDIDFGPNDTLPSIRKEWLITDAKWGSGGTNIPNGSLGDYVEERESEEIKYSLTYNVRADLPIEDVFRSVC